MGFLIGVDTGGTFTDCVVVDEAGKMTIAKAPTTPEDFSRGVIASIENAAISLRISLNDLLKNTAALLHGTTIATNIVISGNGAKTGLLTTKGHRDAIFIMRVAGRTAGLTMEKLQDFATTHKPKPLVPKMMTEEIHERVDYKGKIIVPLNLEKTEESIKRLINKDVESLAVSLLWSFKNPNHELKIREMINRIVPDIPVSISSEIAPRLGEYERTMTTVMNAYTLPAMGRYIRSLNKLLTSKGLKAPLLILQASGGAMAAERAEQIPVVTMNSGPSAGVLGCSYLGELIGHKNIICTDVGGTSFDVGLVVDGAPVISPFSLANQQAMYIPRVVTESIGSGGGTIAHIEAKNLRLKVGPQSAGALPGPACYDSGGTEPTITDADLILGYINPDYFLGGEIKLNKSKAESIIKRKIADPLGMTVEEAAASIVEIVDNQMADLVRKITVETGYDPRDFVLYAYGGAGPTHVGGYARDLGVRQIVCPLGISAGVFSAFGISVSDIKHVYQLSYPMLEPFDLAAIQAAYKDMEGQAKAELTKEGIKEQAISMTRFAELRYKGQINEVSTKVPKGNIDQNWANDMIENFERTYEALYGKGSGFRQGGIEVVAFRVEAVGKRKKPQLAKQVEVSLTASPPLKAKRNCYWREFGKFVESPIYDGIKIVRGNLINGPAIIELPTTTVVVHPKQRLEVDEYGNLLISLM